MRNMAAFALVLPVLGCGDRGRIDAHAETGGTLVVASATDPGTLFPPLAMRNEARQISEQIYDYLADVGPDLNTRDEKTFRPALADRWRWSNDSLLLAFHINPAAKWHDGHDVTARDIEFTFDLNRNPALGSRVESDIANIDSVTVTDSLTAVFWFHKRSPNQFLDAAAQMPILPAHQLEKLRLQALRENPPPPVGSGRFRLKRWDKGASVEIVADTGNYRGRAKLDRVIWSVSPASQTARARLLSGEVDIFDALRPDDVPVIRQKRTLRVVALPGMDYAFLRFNLRDPSDRRRPHPLFGNRELRRAIAMSLDRVAMVRNVLDTFALVPVGPVVRSFPSTDPRGVQLPFDSARAARLLDSLGWRRRAADGVRARNGRQLGFTVLIPTISINRMKMGALIQEQLRRSGVRMEIEPLDVSTEIDRVTQGSFDAALDAWVMPSSTDAVRASWTTAGIGKGGTNYSSYSSPSFDALFDSALWAPDSSARAAYSRAYAVINEDAPAVWLYEPRKLIGLHRRVRTAPMRPDAWWFDLADWYIPVGERISRDRLPFPR
jgi:peptide/nickel transport system substrate-binding protein